MAEMLYLTELLGLPVFDVRRRQVGKIRDAALVPVIDAARVDRYLIGGDQVWLMFRYDQVRQISLNGIYLADEQLTPYHADEYMLRMERDLLDQQIIDAQGHKVVRVTDVTFDVRESEGRDELHLIDIDIGMRSVFRRVCQGWVPRTWVRRMQMGIPPHSIDWALTDILEPDPQRRVRLNINYRHLEEMHPADLADIVEELGPDDREAIFETIDSEVAAEALTEVDPDVQASILESLDTDKAAAILEEMSPSDAADALGELEAERTAAIIEEMNTAPQSEVRGLLDFDDDSAGGLMNTEYLELSDAALVEDAQRALREAEYPYDHIQAVFLVDTARRLRGIVPFSRLLAAPDTAPLMGLAEEECITTHPETPDAHVAELFDKYNLLMLAVVYDDRTLAGVITADDVISVLRNS
jgi:magnesium transporter